MVFFDFGFAAILQPIQCITKPYITLPLTCDGACAVVWLSGDVIYDFAIHESGLYEVLAAAFMPPSEFQLLRILETL
jgi:hypothetical protein